MTAAAYKARLADEADYAEILRLPDKERLPLMAELGKRDLYFLLTVVLRRIDMMRDWIYARVREVEAEPDGYLDLWAREHYKTSVGQGLTMQDIIKDRDVAIGLFSYKKDNAINLNLRPLKAMMENNELLPVLWPEIFWRNPASESPLWSIEQGLTVRRDTTRKEPTVSAWGVIQGQPVGYHFDILDYDDIVTADTISEGMAGKATEAWSASLNLGTMGGRKRMRGTRWGYNDTYAEIMRRQAAKVRLYPATHDGTFEGRPVFMTQEELDQRLKEQGRYVYSAQMLLNPVASSERRLNPDLLQRYKGQNDGSGMNVYILVDPAGSKKKGSDFTVMAVIGIGEDGNKYLLDLVRDRLNLAERIERVIALHRRWRPDDVGWESYGKDSDIEAADMAMRARKPPYHFRVRKLSGTGQSKEQRIERMLPDLEQGRWWWPETLWTARDGQQVDLIRELTEEEMRNFPFALHDDGLDAISRIYDMDAETPLAAGSVRGRAPVHIPAMAERGYNPRAW